MHILYKKEFVWAFIVFIIVIVAAVTLIFITSIKHNNQHTEICIDYPAERCLKLKTQKAYKLD